MKNLLRSFLLVSFLVVASSANAQVVSIACPQSYPPQDTALEVIAPGHKGKGLIEKSGLQGVGIFGGEFGGKVEYVGGREIKVEGGTDAVDFSTPEWFVCYYGGGLSWWEQVDFKGPIKKGCVIQTRDHGKSIRLVCR